MTSEQLRALDRIIRTIPHHGRRRPTDAADYLPTRLTAAAAPQIDHPPVGGVRGLREYQQMLDGHYARLRAEGERKRPPADPIAGLRDAAGFGAGRGGFNWLRGCN